MLGRRLGIAVLAAVMVAAVANVFGQQPTTARDGAAAADLQVHSPARIRGGLEGELRVAVTARRPIAAPRVVLADGWWDRIAIAVIAPEPEGQASDRGSLLLAYPPLPAGERLEIRMTLEVQPGIRPGPRDLGVELRDGARTVASVERDGFVFP